MAFHPNSFAPKVMAEVVPSNPTTHRRTHLKIDEYSSLCQCAPNNVNPLKMSKTNPNLNVTRRLAYTGVGPENIHVGIAWPLERTCTASGSTRNGPLRRRTRVRLSHG